jgi:hypothetical protein
VSLARRSEKRPGAPKHRGALRRGERSLQVLEQSTAIGPELDEHPVDPGIQRGEDHCQVLGPVAALTAGQRQAERCFVGALRVEAERRVPAGTAPAGRTAPEGKEGLASN